MFYVYVLYSKLLNRYYIGSTSNLDRRVQEHNRGKSTFTKKGVPWVLIYKEERQGRSDAWRREMEIKRYKGGIQFKQLLKI
jgi:putative endonuclease